jgi:hypothetical protein
MSRRILDFIRIADGKPYTSPEKHEWRVGKWLKIVGFKSNRIKYQPYGNNNPPDWIVKVGTRWHHIECKTSKKTSAAFNNTAPGKDTLFVFSSQIRNDTMVFYGGDVYKASIKKLVEEYERKAKGLEKKYSNLCIVSKGNPYGFVPGFRLCIRQRGDMQNFFIPETRDMLVRKAKQRHL